MSYKENHRHTVCAGGLYGCDMAGQERPFPRGLRFLCLLGKTLQKPMPLNKKEWEQY